MADKTPPSGLSMLMSLPDQDAILREQIGDSVLKSWVSLEAQLRTCEHCKYWFDGNQPQGFGSCSQSDIAGYHERGSSRIWLVPPAGFGCNLWSPK